MRVPCSPLNMHSLPWVGMHRPWNYGDTHRGILEDYQYYLEQRASQVILHESTYEGTA